MVRKILKTTQKTQQGKKRPGTHTHSASAAAHGSQAQFFSAIKSQQALLL
jgi:hypothetical protein